MIFCDLLHLLTYIRFGQIYVAGSECVKERVMALVRFSDCVVFILGR